MRPLRLFQLTLAIMQSLGFPARRRLIPVSCQTLSNRVRRPPIIKFINPTACCERRVKCLVSSMNHIAQKFSLDTGPNRSPSGKAWEEAWVTGARLTSCSISPQIIRRGVWNPSRNKTILFTEWKNASVHAVVRRKSRRFSLRFPRSISSLDYMDIAVIMIPKYLVTVR